MLLKALWSYTCSKFRKLYMPSTARIRVNRPSHQFEFSQKRRRTYAGFQIFCYVFNFNLIKGKHAALRKIWRKYPNICKNTLGICLKKDLWIPFERCLWSSQLFGNFSRILETLSATIEEYCQHFRKYPNKSVNSLGAFSTISPDIFFGCAKMKKIHDRKLPSERKQLAYCLPELGTTSVVRC